MGYSDRLTGQGPRATDQARLNALGLDHRSPGDTRISLNTFLDFYALTLNHDNLWVPLLQCIRLITLLQPVLLRPCSSRLSNLLIQDMFVNILAPLDESNRGISNEFFNGKSPDIWQTLRRLVSPEYEKTKWIDSQSERWSDIVGELFVVKVGAVNALCIPDFDGGILKYDPRMAPVIANIKKLVAIKGVQAELIVMDYIDNHGDPSGSLPTLVWLRKTIQAKYDNMGLTDELRKLKIHYKELCTVIHAKRFDGSWERRRDMWVELGVFENVSPLWVFIWVLSN